MPLPIGEQPTYSKRKKIVMLGAGESGAGAAVLAKK